MASSATTPRPRRDPTARAGKFNDLRTFMAIPDDEYFATQLQYGKAAQEELRPGCIVHIDDDASPAKNSRIHNRVMLVVKVNAPVCLLCVSFCVHAPALGPDEAGTHWRVASPRGNLRTSIVQPGSANLPSAGADPRMGVLEVALPYGNAWLSPQPGVTVNLRDIWNVEYEGVEVAKLGYVSGEMWNAVRNRINVLFISDNTLSSATATTPERLPLPPIEQIPPVVPMAPSRSARVVERDPAGPRETSKDVRRERNLESPRDSPKEFRREGERRERRWAEVVAHPMVKTRSKGSKSGIGMFGL